MPLSEPRGLGLILQLIEVLGIHITHFGNYIWNFIRCIPTAIYKNYLWKLTRRLQECLRNDPSAVHWVIIFDFDGS
ncbi:unnamed protein product [Acanthoscelides obtectus]|uniref:Uncharacterized protein n=1 Tax=Acanthoscelides obtectus TaxID=200917 RepID=A0A9P0P0K6_ACAOB|nr:unnamed protein product [Acanthoscelides obtectus]CAK1670026.1 hypothetical protein AOBTE_LOCUS27359 [Acanthoscelides obtectus]